ncbi:MAG: NHL repeat-containing protein [Ignavibacteria bacterium]|jgi:DNA-binding beta-propeller fold protein YncE|nr:NHL repeat-containing protein [Ignavibacteria bacterium]
MIFAFIFSFLITAGDSSLTKGTSVTDFMDAVSMTVDAKENIYVLDAGANQIVKFDGQLNYLKRNGKQGWAEGQFDKPTSIDASSGLDIFVSDGKNNRVQRLDLELNYISSLYPNIEDIPDNLKFRTPVASLVLNSSELYVIDKDNNRIVVYRDGKNPSFVFGDYVSGKGQLGNPVKILKDGKNFIYVQDKEQKLIMRYDNLGNYLGRITVNGLETFAIRNNNVYMFDGKVIHVYDTEKNSIVSKKMPDLKNVKGKIRDLLVLNGEKYLLLGKNELSLWREK